MGTFDQFFHRYVLTPHVRRGSGVSPRYLTSWDDLPAHIATIHPPKGGSGIRLSRFALHGNEWEVDERRLNRAERNAWGKLTDWSHGKINEEATKRINGLHNAHVFDTPESRARALQALRDEHSPYLGRLERRFGEIIVDEFQDCDEVEHQLLDLLRSVGIHVVAVADPDQAIYEFRQSTTGVYEKHRDGLDPIDISRLTMCFRSTPAICSLTSSLRSVGLDSLRSDPDHPGGSRYVHVIVGTGLKAGAAAMEVVRQQGVTPRHTRVIAHRRSDARALVRGGNQPPEGVSQMETLLVPLAELHSGIDARGRLAAAKRVEGFVLSQFDWPTGSTVLTRDEQLERLVLRPEESRVVVSKLLVASLQWPDKKSCSTSVRELLHEFASDLPVSLSSRLSQRLVVQEKVWKFWESRTGGMFLAKKSDTVRWSHIHGVKGDEFDGVVLAIPANSMGTTHVLDDWESGLNSEKRRVFYVGASRAGKVLVLVVPKARRDQLLALLSAAEVPHTVTDIK